MGTRKTQRFLILAMAWGVTSIAIISLLLMLIRIQSSQAWSGVVLLLLAELCLIVVYVISKLTIWRGSE